MNEADPRVKRTRKLLQDAFMALMAEKSFHAISVQDIAERATVNRATFYAHFEDKYALLDQVVGEWFQKMLNSRVSAASPFTLSNLHLLIVTVFEGLAGFHAHCKPTYRDLDSRIETKVQQELHKFLMGWLGQLSPGEAEQRATRETVATVMSWAIFGVGVKWSRGAKTVSADEMARQVLDLLTGGLERVVKMPSQARREHDGEIVREVVRRR